MARFIVWPSLAHTFREAFNDPLAGRGDVRKEIYLIANTAELSARKDRSADPFTAQMQE